MAARSKLAPKDQLTIEEFLAFTSERPKGECWELIEGIAVLNPSPVAFHQIICANLIHLLLTEKERLQHPWLAFGGIGTRVPASPNSLPQPDVMVIADTPADTPVAEDALVTFEVLSRSNTKADQAWRRKVYASVPNCQHYVTVSQKEPEVTVYDRASNSEARAIKGRDAVVDLPALGVSLPLAAIYRFTPIA